MWNASAEKKENSFLNACRRTQSTICPMCLCCAMIFLYIFECSSLILSPNKCVQFCLWWLNAKCWLIRILLSFLPHLSHSYTQRLGSNFNFVYIQHPMQWHAATFCSATHIIADYWRGFFICVSFQLYPNLALHLACAAASCALFIRLLFWTSFTVDNLLLSLQFQATFIFFPKCLPRTFHSLIQINMPIIHAHRDTNVCMLLFIAFAPISFSISWVCI